MGSWGVGLYQDDVAADLRSTIALLSKLPEPGDRLLHIILEDHDGSTDLTSDGGPTFWLVLADQFERRGIRCAKVFEQALAAIDTGADLRDLQARGAGASDLKKRATIISALAARFRNPRPASSRPQGARPPSPVVEAGEVYRFPTMDDKAFNPWLPDWERGRFKPNGWGALLVIARGRVFDWFPWCAASSLTVDQTRPPSLTDALQSRFISKKQGGSYFLPRRSHAKKMGLELLGRVALDPGKAAAAVPQEYSPRHAVLCGWSFVSEARAWRGTAQDGIRVADLLASS